MSRRVKPVSGVYALYRVVIAIAARGACKGAVFGENTPFTTYKPVGMNITRRPPQGLRTPGADEGIFILYQRDWLHASSFRARGTNPNILPHWQVCPFAFSAPIAPMQYGAGNSGFGFKPDFERSVQAAGDDFPAMNPSAWLTDNSARAWADHWGQKVSLIGKA